MVENNLNNDDASERYDQAKSATEHFGNSLKSYKKHLHTPLRHRFLRRGIHSSEINFSMHKLKFIQRESF